MPPTSGPNSRTNASAEGFRAMAGQLAGDVGVEHRRTLNHLILDEKRERRTGMRQRGLFRLAVGIRIGGLGVQVGGGGAGAFRIPSPPPAGQTAGRLYRADRWLKNWLAWCNNSIWAGPSAVPLTAGLRKRLNMVALPSIRHK